MSASPSRRRIVHVSAYYPPHLGGVERVAQSLAHRLAALHDVEVWTASIGERIALTTINEGVTVRRFRSREVAHTPIPRGLLRRLLSLPKSAVVHVHVAQALWPELVALAAWIKGFAVVAHFHLDVDPTGSAGWLLPHYKRHLLGRSLRRADRVIVLTASQADLVSRMYGVRSERVVVMANGVDDHFFAVQPVERPDQAPLRVLFVGRLEPQKNVARLLNAMASVSTEAELVIVGDGYLRDDLERLRDDLQLPNVRFVGAQHGDALQDWFAWADVFALTSDREGMPIALLEAMAAGLAVVATDVSDLRDQVGSAGLVVAPDDAAIAAAISSLGDDRTLLAAHRVVSRARGRLLGWGPLVERLDHLYRGIAA